MRTDQFVAGAIVLAIMLVSAPAYAETTTSRAAPSSPLC